MKILITGANGQLGRECRQLESTFSQHTFFFTDVEELDICDESAVYQRMDELRPDVVINGAAYTAVDKAESEPELAFRINAEAVGYLAGACKKYAAFLIHVSTDYVFDGSSKTPYKPNDPASPVSVYAASKRAGEEGVLLAGGPALIVRTSWLYSSFGHNFVKTMLRLGREKGEVRVVNDQLGSPTYAADLARALLTALPRLSGIEGVAIHHYANTGKISWYDFAREIFKQSNIPCKVVPVSSAEFPTPVKRPAYSVLDTTSFSQTFDLSIPDWKTALQSCLTTLLSNQQ